jgi:hypothetical protein
MTDAELLGLVQTELSLLDSGAEWLITILTGYLVIAYAIGRNLSLFQVSFVNIVFILLILTRADANYTSQDVVRTLMELLHEQSPELALKLGYERIHSIAVIWVRPIVMAIVVAGAYAFMWSIRHPKAE